MYMWALWQCAAYVLELPVEADEGVSDVVAVSSISRVAN